MSAKEIFERLIKYTNLTPDAIDDLYYLQGCIEEKDKETERLNNTLQKVRSIIYSNCYYPELNNYVNELDDNDIKEIMKLLGENKDE